MKPLKALLDGIPCAWNGKGDFSIPVHRVHSDSRKIRPGDLFVAVSGLQTDGHRFVSEAIRQGAVAIVSEKFDPAAGEAGIPQLCHPRTRAILAQLVASSYDFPARRLRFIGVTGTNGKTTTAFLIQHLLNQVSRSGLIGTVCYDDSLRKQTAENTTPGPEVLQALFARMVENGASYCVMEVSSHALDQNRVEGIDFSTVVFTNLTQDHLDYHKNYEDYYQAKRKLFFRAEPPVHFIVNADDSYGVRLAGELKNQSGVVTYGMSQTCSYQIREMKLFTDQVKFKLITKEEEIEVSAPLILRHNVYNVACALAVLAEEGFELKELVSHLASFPGVSGRLERIDEGQDFFVFVDYAHTPDGLYNVLSSLEGFPKKRVISVFGCGGDRDRAKRPMMAEIATRYSDLVIFTSDNPRSEKPEDILREIECGVEGDKKTKAVTIVDREDAICHAVQIAEPGDLVFIFGKGHERYQILGKEKRPFSDQEVARRWLRQRCLPFTKSHKLAVER